MGELLQPGGVEALKQLGMAECLEGIDATPVEGYCVVMGERSVPIPYPELEAMAGENREGMQQKLKDCTRATSAEAFSKSGKQEGRSFHHGRFINALRNKVINDAPGVTVVEGSARNLITCDHTRRVIGVQVAVKAKGVPVEAEETVVRNFYAPLTIIADGCFSKFRNAATGSPADPKVLPPIKPIKTRSHFVGAVLKNIPLPQPRHGTVCLTPNGPVLLYQIADKAEETRMLVDVKGKLPSVGDGSLKVSPLLLVRSPTLTPHRHTSNRTTSHTFPPNSTGPSDARSTRTASERCPTRSSRRKCKGAGAHGKA